MTGRGSNLSAYLGLGHVCIGGRHPVPCLRYQRDVEQQCTTIHLHILGLDTYAAANLEKIAGAFGLDFTIAIKYIGILQQTKSQMMIWFYQGSIKC